MRERTRQKLLADDYVCSNWVHVDNMLAVRLILDKTGWKCTASSWHSPAECLQHKEYPGFGLNTDKFTGSVPRHVAEQAGAKNIRPRLHLAGHFWENEADWPVCQSRTAPTLING